MGSLDLSCASHSNKEYIQMSSGEIMDLWTNIRDKTMLSSLCENSSSSHSGWILIDTSFLHDWLLVYVREGVRETTGGTAGLNLCDGKVEQGCSYYY